MAPTQKESAGTRTPVKEGQDQPVKEGQDQDQDGPRSAQARQAADLSGSTADRRTRERKELAARLRELDQEDRADGVTSLPPDKTIHLSDGTSVDITGAVPTHYDNGDGPRRVLRFDPIESD